jgi:hypothetical protein
MLVYDLLFSVTGFEQPAVGRSIIHLLVVCSQQKSTALTNFLLSYFNPQVAAQNTAVTVLTTQAKQSC